MAGVEKGFLGGGMQFGVGDDVPEARTRGPLLPLRVLCIANLVPSSDFNAGAAAPELPIEVDPTEPDGLFDRLRPRLAVEVPSVLHEGRSVRMDLSLKNLKSFRPDGLCAEVPLLRKLLDGRMVLDRLRDGSLRAEEAPGQLSKLWEGSPFAHEVLGLIPSAGSGGGGAGALGAGSGGAGAQALGAATAPGDDSPPASMDGLLSMVDLGGSSSAPAEPEASPAAAAAKDAMGKLSSLVAQVARSARGTKGGVRPDEALARIDKAIGVQLGAILQHPEVRRLEQAWRGIAFMVERAKGIEGLKLEVLSASPDDAAAGLGRAVKNASGGPPISCAVVDATIDGTAAGFALLEAVSDAAEGYNVPVVMNGSAGLFGMTDLADVDRLDNKGALFTAPVRAPWRSAVAKPATRWVTLAMNEVLARGPYTKSTARLREAPSVAESPNDDDAYVWMSPCFAVGTLITQSFKQTGWPCRITGPREGMLENLPVREVEHGTSTVAIPTRAFVSTDGQRELSRYGVLLLAAAMNNDQVHVLSAPTAYVTPEKRTYDSPTQEPEVRLERVPLGDQLFVARLVQFARALCSKIPGGSDPGEVAPVIEGAVWALFEDGPPAGPQLSVTARRGDDGGVVVSLTVRPRRFLGVGLDEISLDLPVG